MYQKRITIDHRLRHSSWLQVHRWGEGVPAIKSVPVANTHSIRSHTTIFAARKLDGTLRREVKGKKRPFVRPGPRRPRILPAIPLPTFSSNTRPYHYVGLLFAPPPPGPFFSPPFPGDPVIIPPPPCLLPFSLSSAGCEPYQLIREWVCPFKFSWNSSLFK